MAMDNQNIAPAIHARKGHLTGWRLSANDEHVVFDERRGLIVNVQFGGGTGRNYNQATDIARLIAAAPEMLEALKALLSELEHKGSDGWMTGNVHGDDYDRARAAITKADG